MYRSDPAGASYFSGGEFHAGFVSVPTSMTVAAVYKTIGGILRQSVPVTITVLTTMQGTITAERQGTTGVVNYSTSGTPTVRWDTDLDGDFDDGIKEINGQSFCSFKTEDFKTEDRRQES